MAKQKVNAKRIKAACDKFVRRMEKAILMDENITSVSVQFGEDEPIVVAEKAPEELKGGE